MFGLREDFHPGGEGPDGGRHHGLGRRPAGALDPGAGPSSPRQVCRELRAPPVPAAGRRHPPGLRQADRAGARAARKLHLELRAADPGGRPGARGRGGRLLQVHGPDAGACARRRRGGHGPAYLCRRRTPGWSTASPPRTRATCSCGPTWSTRAACTWPGWRPCSSAGCRRTLRSTRRSTRWSRAAATTRRSPGPHPLPRGLQSRSPPRAARALCGVHQLDDRQVALHHGRGLGGRADEGAVQRASRDHRPERRPRVATCSRASGVPLLRGLRGPQVPREPRRQPPRARALVPDVRRRSARPGSCGRTATSRSARTSSSAAGRCLRAGSATG